MAAARSQLRKFWHDTRVQENEERRAVSLSASLPSLTTTMRDTWRTDSTHNRSRGKLKKAASGLPALESDTLPSKYESQDDYETHIQKVLDETERKYRWETGNYLDRERSQRLRDVQGDLENREVAAFSKRSKEAAESDGKPKYVRFKNVVLGADEVTKCMRAEEAERIKETSLDEHRTLRSVLRIDDTIDVARMMGKSGTDEENLQSAMKSEVFMNVLANLQALRHQVNDLREARRAKTEEYLTALATIGKTGYQFKRSNSQDLRSAEVPEVEEHKAPTLKRSLGKMDSWMSQHVAAWQKAGMFSSSKSTGAWPRPPVETTLPTVARPSFAETDVITKAAPRR
eukprot:TRINITY_DN20828_c0_g1_i1.p1 TRINITY_DN20828_c0_g1~~TRINITY_DN20828_c0_g1_i1.p1  ORF type:complete len:344 (-),score=67.55 TRINITY_DN20828_c0_g1_i1:56-1087(-)